MGSGVFLLEPRLAALVLVELLGDLAAEEARGDGVDADRVARPLDGQLGREPRQPHLAGGVGRLRDAGHAHPAADRRHVDDGASPRLHHVRERTPGRAPSVPTRFRSSVWRIASIGSASAASRLKRLPAAFTRISGPPSSAATCGTTLRTCSRSRRSHATASPPMSSASARRRSFRRATTATVAPTDARPRADAFAETGRRPGHERDPIGEVEAAQRARAGRRACSRSSDQSPPRRRRRPRAARRRPTPAR